MNSIVIELPGIKAISRNDTTGHWIKYKHQLALAEDWMKVYGKRLEYHFTTPVTVTIDAYYKAPGKRRIPDPANVDDKIYTDVLIRWVNRTVGIKNGKKLVERVERSVWFIEDDDSDHITQIHKRVHRSETNKVVITIQST